MYKQSDKRMDKSSNLGWECSLADPSWDVGGEYVIPEFVPPPADPSWDVGGECFI